MASKSLKARVVGDGVRIRSSLHKQFRHVSYRVGMPPQVSRLSDSAPATSSSFPVLISLAASSLFLVSFYLLTSSPSSSLRALVSSRTRAERVPAPPPLAASCGASSAPPPSRLAARRGQASAGGQPLSNSTSPSTIPPPAHVMAGSSELNVDAVDKPEMPKLSALPKVEDEEKPIHACAPVSQRCSNAHR